MGFAVARWNVVSALNLPPDKASDKTIALCHLGFPQTKAEAAEPIEQGIRDSYSLPVTFGIEGFQRRGVIGQLQMIKRHAVFPGPHS